jgi:hypothetical protein
MVSVERGFWSVHLVVNGMAPIGPLQMAHYVPLYNRCYSTLDYIIGRGLINRRPPFISTGVEIYISIYFTRYLK